MFSRRLRDLILSVYLYNEWRGYLQLESDLIPELELRVGKEDEFLKGVKKHAADERRHYRMFKGWFLASNVRPFAVGPSVGYFDRVASWFLEKGTAESSAGLVDSPQSFARLCRAVITTERRGIAQLDALLKWGFIARDARLRNLLQTIRRDEPFHSLPYECWLAARGLPGPDWKNRISDALVHYSIAVLVIPRLYFTPWLRRLEAFQDDAVGPSRTKRDRGHGIRDAWAGLPGRTLVSRNSPHTGGN